MPRCGGEECPEVENDSSDEGEFSYDAQKVEHCAWLAFITFNVGGGSVVVEGGEVRRE